MFGSVGPSEIIFLAIILLLIFGAKRLPEIGKFFGLGLKEFKKASSEIEKPFESEEKKQLENKSNLSNE